MTKSTFELSQKEVNNLIAHRLLIPELQESDSKLYANIKKCSDKKGDLILEAVEMDNAKMLNYFFEKGMAPEDSSSENHLVHEAAANNKLDVLKCLVEHCKNIDINHLDANGMTALDCAIAKGNFKVTKFLTERYPDIINFIPKDTPISFTEGVGFTPPLVRASQNDQLEIFEHLIENGADINYINKENMGDILGRFTNIKNKITEIIQAKQDLLQANKESDAISKLKETIKLLNLKIDEQGVALQTIYKNYDIKPEEIDALKISGDHTDVVDAPLA